MSRSQRSISELELASYTPVSFNRTPTVSKLRSAMIYKAQAVKPTVLESPSRSRHQTPASKREKQVPTSGPVHEMTSHRTWLSCPRWEGGSRPVGDEINMTDSVQGGRSEGRVLRFRQEMQCPNHVPRDFAPTNPWRQAF